MHAVLPVTGANMSRNDFQLSVIIATCNRAEQLGRALESLSRQSVPVELFEVIVVDNGSDNTTQVIVQAHLKKQPHWKLLKELRPGAAAARNAGIRASRAPILLFLDDDIVADPEVIEQHLQSHRERSGIAVLGAVRFPWKGNESPFFWCLHRHPELFQSFRFPDPQDVPFQYFYTCNLSLTKSFFNQAEGFDEGFTASGFEDTELGYRFVKAGFHIIFNERASALHDVRTNLRLFSQKRYASGQWAGHFVSEYPELRATLFGSSSLRSKISSFVGLSATPLRPLFDARGGALNRLFLPVLGILCWHHLQYRFRTGFCSNSLSRAAYLQKQSSVNSMR
jgi:glycosyltransferase involved in cell wall biosynthesis